MKHFLNIIAMVALTAGLSTAHAAQPIEGDWAVQFRDNGFTFDMTFSIGGGTIKLTNLCRYQGASATAKVSAPAQYDESTITVTGSAHDSQSMGGLNCEASLTPDTMNYKVEGNVLTLTHEGSSDKLVLTRK